MKTKEALIWDFHQPWSVEEIEIGDPRKGEVKVALEVAGMCHSDHHVVTGDIPVAAFPDARRSRGCGEGVEDLEPGDHVAASFIPSCGTCRSCQVGLRNLCGLGMGLMSGIWCPTGPFGFRREGRMPIRTHCSALSRRTWSCTAPPWSRSTRPSRSRRAALVSCGAHHSIWVGGPGRFGPTR